MERIFKGNQGIYKIYGHSHIRQDIFSDNGTGICSRIIHNSTDSINDNQDRKKVESIIERLLHLEKIIYG